MHKIILIGLLVSFIVPFIRSQEPYNSCPNAQRLCPSIPFAANNIGATSSFCENCEDDFEFCFTGENTVWFYFETNQSGGDVTVSFSNLAFEQNEEQGDSLQAIVIKASLPCIPSSYEQVSNCEVAANPFSLIAEDLDSNSVYYIIVNGQMGESLNAEAQFDIEVSGEGVDRFPFIYIGVLDSTAVCRGESVTFVATLGSCDNNQPINWYADSTLISVTEGNVFITTELQDSVVITATTTCFESCMDTVKSNELLMTVIDFYVNAGPDFEILEGESVQLEGASDQEDIIWTPNIAISNPHSLTPFVSPTQTTQYYLTANNGYCTITDFCEVIVRSGLEIPNTFSPNGDGINDAWEILGIDEFPDCFVQIYNRWGQLVFQTTGYSSGKQWDGTSQNGRELAPSVYYYVINLRDEDYPDPIKGHVTIIR